MSFFLSLHLIIEKLIILHERSGHETHEKGSESETETDDIHIPQDHEFPDDLLRVTTTLNTQNTYDELLTE